jgi:Ca2+-binding EF-hand superfamily protein
MKILKSILDYIHLDPIYNYLTIKSVKIIFTIYSALDIHDEGLNSNNLDCFKRISLFIIVEFYIDIQFFAFMKHVTNLKSSAIRTVFEKLDVDRSGTLEFEEFYFLVCVLVSVKVFIFRFYLLHFLIQKLFINFEDNREKEFIYRHSRTVFDILDEDGSDTVSAEEFNNIGFLFNFRRRAVYEIFNDFDISGDQVKIFFL